jgi:hypothetical protein
MIYLLKNKKTPFALLQAKEAPLPPESIIASGIAKKKPLHLIKGERGIVTSENASLHFPAGK